MTIYNAIIQIIKKNKGVLLLGLLITVVITFFYAGQLKEEQSDLTGAKIVILNQDNSEISQSLVTQLTQRNQQIQLKDTSQKGLDDALYFERVDYILTIPKNFGSDLWAGKKVTVDSQTKPGTFSKTLVDSNINSFLNTFETYRSQMAGSDQADILALTNDTLVQKGTVKFDQTYQQKKRQGLVGNIFNLLAYGLFSTIFSGYAVINLAFNRKEIRDRNSCSPISRRKLSRRISTASLVYSMVCFLIFMVYMVIVTESGWDVITGYFILNSLIFLSVMVSFSILVTSIMKNSESIAGINNVFIMGSCFIGGIFVPSEILPDFVSKIAAFTPTYWFAQNNLLLGKTVVFNQAFKEQFLQQSLILCAFTAVFLVIHLISMKEKGGLKIFGKKSTVSLES
ncbi:ABC transporter permease [Enterococcus alishanensis]|uniref:ABC transporter permease n=1 Tax=Enterococcus alishanensis TaxID=1303817 RepID=A0ABS6TCV6_9ENTE|nr:ABC transporter permease [Enterococcus alishanensis]MBV7390755.1 ABC transporter permease [Enterococcus alishanensis]